VAYANNVNAGIAEITITGIGKYKNTKTTNLDIQQANVSFWFETSDGQEAKELTTTYGDTFTKPVLKMSETAAADVIGVVYSVDNEEVATINSTT
jgi:predicted metal-dependent peptidase